MINHLVTVAGLIVCTWTDMRERKIYLPVIVVTMITLFGVQAYTNRLSPTVAATGICIGVVFFFLCLVTRGQIGIGDAFLFTVVAFSRQGVSLIYCIFLTFFFLFGAAVVMIVFRRCGREEQLPVAPFLLAAYLLVFALGR